MTRWMAKLVLAMVFWTNAVADTLPTVHEFVLDNGLKLLVQEDHRAPVVVSQVWYKVGSSYEHGGITGISHILEHMMFKGTERIPPGAFSRIIAKEGGQENAFTGRDYTAYYQSLEASRLHVSFELEADRMRNLVLQDAAFELERQVVMEERRSRTDDNPQSLTYEHFQATAFTNSPYQHPVIGWMTDIAGYRLDDLQAWYRRWYTPSNATVVVVGDVVAEDVLALARKHFGSIAGTAAPAPKISREVVQLGERRIVTRRPATVPYLIMGYKVPTLRTANTHWEPFALTVLAGVLDGNGSARFGRRLVRGSEIAASAGAEYDIFARLTSLFVLTAIPANGKSVADLEKALRTEIAEVRHTPVSPRELLRVKNQVVAENVFARDSLFYQAMELGRLETVGVGWQRRNEFVSRVRSVTAEQVQAVAEKYLIDNSLTVAVLEPQPLQSDQARNTVPTASHVR